MARHRRVETGVAELRRRSIAQISAFCSALAVSAAAHVTRCHHLKKISAQYFARLSMKLCSSFATNLPQFRFSQLPNKPDISSAL